MSPEATVKRLLPHLAAFGITRLARQTGLDRVGIPCWAAFRPNALTLSNSQGKGMSDGAARASALMEAVEFAIAEAPQVPVQMTSLARLNRDGRRAMDFGRQMPVGQALAPTLKLPFIEGFDLFAPAEPIAVPLDGAMLVARPGTPAGLARSTNGLASGNTMDEAIFHGLCELVERDCTTLTGLTRQSRPTETVSPELFADARLDELVRRIREAGLDLWLTEESNDLGVPAFRAVLADQGARHFDLAAGYGCHPAPARAAIRAVTEAAQTRVTNIAGSRDDFLPHEYERRADPAIVARLRAAPPARRLRSPGMGSEAKLETMLGWLAARLHRAGVTDIACAPLGGAEWNIAVVKLVAPQLEDRPPNRNWRPGARALAALKVAA